MGELRGPHGQSWQPRRKAGAAWIKQIEDNGSNGNNENGQSGPHNQLEGEPHSGCCQKYGLGLDGRSHAEEHASYTTQQIIHYARKLARKKQSLWSLSCSSWSSTKAHQLDPQHYDILQSIGLTLHVEEETPQNKNIAREI